MLIYPEGTRNKTTAPLKSFYDGAFKLSVDTQKYFLAPLAIDWRSVFSVLRIFTEMQKEKPTFFTGFGLEASQDKIREKCKIHNLNNEYGEYNFHNQFIQTFAEIGIIGLLILIAMLTVNLFNGIKQKDFLHIAFAITMIMLFLSESFFCRQRGIVFFTLLYCLFNANNHISQRDNIK
jgi:O-antigen ligase